MSYTFVRVINNNAIVGADRKGFFWGRESVSAVSSTGAISLRPV